MVDDKYGVFEMVRRQEVLDDLCNYFWIEIEESFSPHGQQMAIFMPETRCEGGMVVDIEDWPTQEALNPHFRASSHYVCCWRAVTP